MNSMLVYKICFEDLGNNVFLDPRIPLHPAKNEDTKINRIPVCTTIPNCIKALELASMITKDNPVLTVYVYATEVPMEYLEHPNKYDVKVPDQWRTGELWVMYPWMFTKLGKATIRKHMEIPYSAYSRYAFKMENFDEVVDRICAGPIYGEMVSFSFIDLDNERVESAFEFAEKRDKIDELVQTYLCIANGIHKGAVNAIENAHAITQLDINPANNNEVIEGSV